MSTNYEKKGILTVISGFSGAGKGTIVKELVSRYPELYRVSVSVTTREKRNGEIEGVSYHYITQEQFDKMVQDNELIEYAGYVGNSYGTPRKFVEEQIAQGRNVILEIEYQGALQVKEKYPQALMLFVTPPQAHELPQRLRGRQTETEESIAKRLNTAYHESFQINRYDFLVINDDLDKAVEQTHQMIQNGRFLVRRNETFIKNIQEQLKNYAKGEQL